MGEFIEVDVTGTHLAGGCLPPQKGPKKFEPTSVFQVLYDISFREGNISTVKYNVF